MSDGGFEKVTRSEKTLYGPRKLILCGFAAGMQANIHKILEYINLKDLGLIWATEDQADDEIRQIVQLPSGSGSGTDSALPRTIVVAGVTENDLHNFMNTCRASGMQAALWAVLTPASEKWTLRQLIAELDTERAALAQKN